MNDTETSAPVTGIPRIGDPAPTFTAVTTQGEIIDQGGASGIRDQL